MPAISQMVFSSYIFLNENVWFLLKISLKFVPKVPINSIPALVQIMAWRRLGDKPLSEPVMITWSKYASFGLIELTYDHIKGIMVGHSYMYTALLCDLTLNDD